jgi:hypothetical protein
MIVTAQINIESPTGRRLVRELEKHHKVVKLNYQNTTEIEGVTSQTYTYDEFKNNVKIEFKKRYGVNFDEV